MTVLEQKVAIAICERLFGPFDASELDSPSSVSAQSLDAARVVIGLLDSVLLQSRPAFLKA